MNTLYDILGVGRQATSAQIEHGYRERLNLLKEQGGSVEEDINQMRAIKEAYLTLSSPTKRQAYDEKLTARPKISYQVVESKPLPWATIILVVTILLSGSLYYHNAQQKKERQARMELETAKAKAEAEKAAQLAAREEAALERARLLKIQQDEATNQRLSATARYEGQRIHSDMERLEREQAREKERQLFQAKLDQEREERLAKARSQEQIYKMQRALNIPVYRH